MAGTWCTPSAREVVVASFYCSRSSRALAIQTIADAIMAATKTVKPTTRILIVEDDPHILLGLEEVLKSDGFEVVVCSRGDQALDVVAGHRPALIVLDIMLPGLSGFDVCRQLRAKKISTPILMLTAKSQELDKVVGLDLGAHDYVAKPF